MKYCTLNSIKEEACITTGQIRFNHALTVMTTAGERNAITSWIIPVNFVALTWRPMAFLPVRLRDIGMWWSDAAWRQRFERRIFMVNFTLEYYFNTRIRNVGNHSANNTLSLHKRPEFSISPPREPQNRNSKDWPVIPSVMWFGVV
jgi:hypothetical protein